MKFQKLVVLPFTLSKNYKLGSGGYSTVYISNVVFDNNKIKVCAIKQTTRSHKNYLRNEAIILSKLNHKSLPKIYNICKKDNSYYMVMEHIFGFDLHKLYNTSNTTKFDNRLVISELVCVIKYLHDNDIVHFDIKLENIILEQHTNRVVLVDFGLSKSITYNNLGKEVMFNKIVGSTSYISPEMRLNHIFYGKPCDIYSLGITISGILWNDVSKFDYPDGYPVNVNLIIETIKNSEYFDYGMLLENMLTSNLKNRYNIEVIYEVIKNML